MVAAPFPVLPQDLQARELRYVLRKRIGPAFVVPVGPTHIWRLVLAKWANGKILHVACAAKLIHEFSGWCFKGYEFQKAVDAASSPQGNGTVLVARNVTLSPTQDIDVCGRPPYPVYAVLKARDTTLTVASLGGPWRIRLHRGGGMRSDPRCLLLTGETSIVTGQGFSLEACEGHEYEGNLSLQLRFRPAVHVTDEVHHELRAFRDTNGRLAGYSTSSLTAYLLLGRDLKPGDELEVNRGFTQEFICLYQGTRGVVSSARKEARGCVFSVRWAVHGEPRLEHSYPLHPDLNVVKEAA